MILQAWCATAALAGAVDDHLAGRCQAAQEALYAARAAGDGRAAIHLAYCLREDGQLDEALACALDAEPDPIESVDAELADCLTLLERHEEALSYYLRLVDSDPMSLLNLAGCLYDCGRAQAEEVTLLALSSLPECDAHFPYALELLAIVREDSSLLAEAHYRMELAHGEDP